MEGVSYILLGLSMLVLAWVLRRTFRNSGRIRRRKPLAEVRAEITAAERMPQSAVRDMEVRLHDYGREVEGRIQGRLTMLDHLIDDADREIAELERLLAESRRTRTDPGELTLEERCRAYDLFELGLSTTEIAGCLKRPERMVDALFDIWQDDRPAEAA